MSSHLAAELADAALSDETKRTYAKVERSYESWCVEAGLEAWPSSERTLARYLATRESKSIQRYQGLVSAIIHGHKRRGFPSPITDGGLVRRMLAGMARTHAAKPKVKVSEDPIRFADAMAMISMFKDAADPAIWKKAAYLALGVFLGLRHDNLRRLRTDDLTIESDGLTVQLRRSKSDQAAAGQARWLAHLEGCPDSCPACAVVRHVESLPPESRLFSARGKTRTSPSGICVVTGTRWLNELCAKSGRLLGKEIRTRSMRSGFITSLLDSGVPIHDVAAAVGHRKITTTARYDRRNEAEKAYHLDV